MARLSKHREEDAMEAAPSFGGGRIGGTLFAITLLPLAVAALVLAGCATPSTTLVNQDLDTIRCSATNRGPSGTPSVVANRERCVREFKSLGYVELPDVVLGIKPSFAGTAPTVQAVIAGSPADKAGMKPGDVIQSMGGNQVQSFKDFVGALGSKRAGDVLPIVVRRGGTTLEFAPVLERR
jgi:membrane-associated protease RseP (regulator of RpoE activity)